MRKIAKITRKVLTDAKIADYYIEDFARAYPYGVHVSAASISQAVANNVVAVELLLDMGLLDLFGMLDYRDSLGTRHLRYYLNGVREGVRLASDGDRVRTWVYSSGELRNPKVTEPCYRDVRSGVVYKENYNNGTRLAYLSYRPMSSKSPYQISLYVSPTDSPGISLGTLDQAQKICISWVAQDS